MKLFQRDKNKLVKITASFYSAIFNQSYVERAIIENIKIGSKWIKTVKIENKIMDILIL